MTGSASPPRVRAESAPPPRARRTRGDRQREAIVAAANECGCDLIFMASHGRHGLTSFLLGSQTQKVLTHSGIPVLVYR